MIAKRDILEGWYEEVWAQGNVDAIPQYMNTETRAEGLFPDMSVNQEELNELVQAMRRLARDFEITIPISMDKGDWLAAVVEIKATSVPKGLPVYAVCHVMVRFEGAHMVETYNCLDFLSVFEQLGQLPENSLALLLSGTELG